MTNGFSHHQDWLDAEQDGRDDAAEMAFARLMTELPGTEPSPEFVGRAVHAAWRARARRRLMTRLARVAAVVLVTVATVVSIYLFGMVILGALVRGTVLVAQGLVWLMTSVGEGVRWWSIAGRVGTAVGQTIAAPKTTAIVAALELIGAMAIYAFQRVWRDEDRDDSQKVPI